MNEICLDLGMTKRKVVFGHWMTPVSHLHTTGREAKTTIRTDGAFSK